MGSGFLKKKRAMHAVQQQMQSAQSSMLSRMETLEVIGKAPNDLVVVHLKGSGKVSRIEIQPACVRPDDIEGLQDLIKVAINDASAKLEEATQNLIDPASNLSMI